MLGNTFQPPVAPPKANKCSWETAKRCKTTENPLSTIPLLPTLTNAKYKPWLAYRLKSPNFVRITHITHIGQVMGARRVSKIVLED